MKDEQLEGRGGLKKRGGRTEKMEGGHRGAERVTTDEGRWRKKALWVGDLYPVKAPPLLHSHLFIENF